MSKQNQNTAIPLITIASLQISAQRAIAEVDRIADRIQELGSLFPYAIKYDVAESNLQLRQLQGDLNSLYDLSSGANSISLYQAACNSMNTGD